MTPLFCELEELGKSEDPEQATLDIEEFVDALGRLYDEVANPQKHIILNECAADDPPDNQNRPQSALARAQKSSSQMTFKPQINPTSVAILESKSEMR